MKRFLLFILLFSYCLWSGSSLSFEDKKRSHYSELSPQDSKTLHELLKDNSKYKIYLKNHFFDLIPKESHYNFSIDTSILELEKAIVNAKKLNSENSMIQVQMPEYANSKNYLPVSTMEALVDTLKSHKLVLDTLVSMEEKLKKLEVIEERLNKLESIANKKRKN